MLLGPVFRSELLRTARRRRYYAIRVLYGLLLLFILWAGYENATRWKSTVTIAEAASFALRTFLTFSAVQLIAILMLIPALFGGAIADEKQRKTLHYLMASQLSSFEIVVDKVLGRAPHVAVFLSLGLPVVCLLGLVGGVPPEYVAMVYVGTASTALMAVALTVLVSTLSRRVGQAVLIAYVLMLGWQVVPAVVYIFCVINKFYSGIYRWVEPVNTWVGATSPPWVFLTTMIRTGGAGRGSTWFIVEQLAWMVGLQVGAAALLILLAVWRLRPAFRRHESTQPRRRWFEGGKAKSKARPRAARRPRWWDRPECGEDAMAWKERHFARTDVLTKMVVLPAIVFVSVVLIMYVGLDSALAAVFSNFWRMGFLGWGNGDVLVGHIRVVSAWYVAIWLLAVAGASASSVAVEREEDTWVSLTSTPLTGWEILRGKVFGAVWAQRGFAFIPLGLWGLGLATGSVHPIGVLVAVLALGVATWMVAAVGIWASLRSTSTSKALASTIATLAVLFGYPGYLFAAFLGENLWDTYAAFVGLPPRLVVGPLVSYPQFDGAWRQLTLSGFRSVSSINAILFGLIATGFYASIAASLTVLGVGGFDRWLDRPEIFEDGPDASKPKDPAEEAEPALQS